MNKKPKKLYYLLGIFCLALVLFIGIHVQNTNDLNQEITEYIFNKQEISDALGDVVAIRDKPFLLLMAENKKQKISVQIRGSKATGSLTATATFEKNLWSLHDITLNDNNIPLSPLYVGHKEFYAASIGSAPLLEPLFIEGEDIFIKFLLRGVRRDAKGIFISENIAIYNDNQELVATNDNAASYQKTAMTDEAQGIDFTNKISPLKPGLYYVRFQFEDKLAKDRENFWQEIRIKKMKKDLFVRSLKYFNDQKRSEMAKENIFTAEQNIYLRMNLAGFLVQDKKIAGVVDLKITDSQGETIAYQPKFAAFNQIYQKDHDIFVDGEIRLKQPDIYFLSFRIEDYFSKQNIQHQEKIIVSLP